MDNLGLTPQFRGGPALVTGHSVLPDTKQGAKGRPRYRKPCPFD